MIKVGLTGNLGAGKSTVAALLASRGAAILDSDRLVHEMLAADGEAVAPVLALFPEAAGPEGSSVDRGALARIVFGDPGARRRLESVLHPLVQSLQDRWLAACRERGIALAVVEATLLFEAWRAGGPDPRTRFDALVVVRCDEAVQRARSVARLVARGTHSGDQAARDVASRLAAQMPQDEKAALADFVVDNSFGADATEGQVDALVASLLARDAGGGATMISRSPDP